jgi:hypothetical protein
MAPQRTTTTATTENGANMGEIMEAMRQMAAAMTQQATATAQQSGKTFLST